MCRNIIPYYSNANPNNSYRVGLLQEGVIDIEFTALSSTATLGLGGDLPQAINIGGSTPEEAAPPSKPPPIQYPVMQQINPLLYSYRFGFNGKEDDKETGYQDYGMRIYDPRIAKFISADPLIVKGQQYAWFSPYHFAGNTPIMAIDLDGLEVLLVGKQESAGVIFSIQVEAGILIDLKNKSIFSYQCSQGGLTSTVSVSTGVSVTFYPNMPAANYASGWGGSAGVGAGELVVGSVDIAYSSGYWGINVSGGIGGSLAPADGHVYAGYTIIKPINHKQAKQYIANLNTAKSNTQKKTNELNAKNNNLQTTNNQKLQLQKKNATSEDVTVINKQITENQKKINKNNSDIYKNKQEIKSMNELKQGLDNAIIEISK